MSEPPTSRAASEGGLRPAAASLDELIALNDEIAALARAGVALGHHSVEAPIDVDNRGVFFLNSRVTELDIPDGEAHTIFIGPHVGPSARRCSFRRPARSLSV